MPGFRSISRTCFVAAGLVLALALEGHVGVTSLKTLKLADLAGRSGIIVLASPLKSFAATESLAFQGGIPPLERRVFCFKRGDILKNAYGADIPDTLMVFQANTAASAQAHAMAHSGGEVESPVTYTYAGSLKEERLGKEKSVLLFLTLRREKGVTPSEWFELAAAHGYEKASQAKAVAKLLPKSQEPAPFQPE
jgi:hypothetical protein